MARITGGLHQIIQDYDPTEATGNGFVFFDETPAALWDAIRRTKKVFTQPARWKEIMLRAMSADFSWPAAAERYEKVFESVM